MKQILPFRCLALHLNVILKGKNLTFPLQLCSGERVIQFWWQCNPHFHISGANRKRIATVSAEANSVKHLSKSDDICM